MQHIGRVDILETSQYLVEEVADLYSVYKNKDGKHRGTHVIIA